VLTQHPFAVTDLTGDLKILRARLTLPQPETRPERREISSSNPGGEARAVQSGKDHPQDKGSTPSRAKPWLFGGIILVLLLGLYRFVHLKLRGPAA
jgi:hypothetical protein